jgi:hypothetical protein
MIETSQVRFERRRRAAPRCAPDHMSIAYRMMLAANIRAGWNWYGAWVPFGFYLR